MDQVENKNSVIKERKIRSIRQRKHTKQILIEQARPLEHHQKTNLQIIGIEQVQAKSIYNILNKILAERKGHAGTRVYQSTKQARSQKKHTYTFYS
jgi:hypothetical protein